MEMNEKEIIQENDGFADSELTNDVGEPCVEENNSPENSECVDDNSAENIAPENKENEADALKDKLLRVMAEYENYKRRTAKEKEELFVMSTGNAVMAFLPVIDNLQRALASCNEAEEDNQLMQGVKMVERQFLEVLKDLGVEEIKTDGETFNPDFHNAVMHIEDENYGEGAIIEEFMKGYKFKDRVIRHSMVKVAN